jgi:hypothetical protein
MPITYQKSNQKNINHLTRSITSNEIEAVVKSLTTRKSPSLNSFTVEFYQTFKKELTPMLFTLFHLVEKKEVLQNSVCEASITLMLKPDKVDSNSKKEITDQFP